MIITILGFMGSGKSTLGKRLATELEMVFMDLDDYIEQKENRSIPDIFKEDGESHFRKLESQYLEEIVNKDNNVILALGGGTPCNEDNWPILRKTQSVYFKRSKKRLFKNLEKRKAGRPLIKDLSTTELEEFIKMKMKERKPMYEKADIIVKGKGGKKKFVSKALKKLKKKGLIS